MTETATRTVDEPVCVTGAAGFTGFHFAKALHCRGRALHGIDNINVLKPATPIEEGVGKSIHWYREY